jgi:hypothetical protein
MVYAIVGSLAVAVAVAAGWYLFSAAPSHGAWLRENGIAYRGSVQSEPRRIGEFDDEVTVRFGELGTLAVFNYPNGVLRSGDDVTVYVNRDDRSDRSLMGATAGDSLGDALGGLVVPGAIVILAGVLVAALVASSQLRFLRRHWASAQPDRLAFGKPPSRFDDPTHRRVVVPSFGAGSLHVLKGKVPPAGASPVCWIAHDNRGRRAYLALEDGSFFSVKRFEFQPPPPPPQPPPPTTGGRPDAG